MILRRTALAALACAAFAAPAFAQTYPGKPIHLIVPYPAGGGTDFFARLVGQKMQELIGQPVVVENKPGAATNLGADFVAKAQPDGYTILLGDVATFAANQSLYKKIPFDAEKDFAPITLTARFVSGLLVNQNKLKVNSVAELIAAAKAEPGKIDVAHAASVIHSISPPCCSSRPPASSSTKSRIAARHPPCRTCWPAPCRSCSSTTRPRARTSRRAA